MHACQGPGQHLQPKNQCIITGSPTGGKIGSKGDTFGGLSVEGLSKIISLHILRANMFLNMTRAMQDKGTYKQWSWGGGGTPR